ncbi:MULTISPECIES: GNAT family N-acetyltransferase [Anaerotruncus]|uniref:GNAT family N-acetyltransferase n=1 Tax=Anaerotruncus TaxID=244127 RepID=UPI000831CCAF|nr:MULTISPECIES: GNAT family N-acetyltransferase [Anaerotruncus]RGX50842.1 GNAT family N-acetyltransferase [Anaerotruncus sp. AF02-27]
MIRKVTAEDREVFLPMLREFYHSPAVLHPIPGDHFERTFAQIAAGSPLLEAYLFVEEGGIAGYAQISYTWSNEAGGLCAWIEEIYVRPQFQGKGIGARFFREFEEKSQGKISRIRLEVEADNTGASRLYERLGFEKMPYLQMYKELDV